MHNVVQKHQHINVQCADAGLQHNMRITNRTTRPTQAALTTIIHVIKSRPHVITPATKANYSYSFLTAKHPHNRSSYATTSRHLLKCSLTLCGRLKSLPQKPQQNFLAPECMT